ncbi:MAG: acyltransferase [Bacteroidales bacterium]|jgi:galactoside O-acetyltransferase|nr:acyltransferase [Bacteroidales bacterium]
MPFKALGKNVLISRFARFYGIEDMEIGNDVRIDDYCILSGKIILGNYIHISAFCALYGRFGIEIMDYSGLSPRCTLFSASDDFSGGYLIGPMVDSSHTHVTGGKIVLEKYCQLGAGCVVMPNLIIHEGVTIGAMSFINKNLDEWSIYKGIPAVFYKKRSKRLLAFFR